MAYCQCILLAVFDDIHRECTLGVGLAVVFHAVGACKSDVGACHSLALLVLNRTAQRLVRADNEVCHRKADIAVWSRCNLSLIILLSLLSLTLYIFVHLERCAVVCSSGRSQEEADVAAVINKAIRECQSNNTLDVFCCDSLTVVNRHLVGNLSQAFCAFAHESSALSHISNPSIYRECDVL